MEYRIGKCKKHGATMFRHSGSRANGDPHFRCCICRLSTYSPQRGRALQTRRAAIRAELIEHFGGCCIRCGYKKSAAALHFHHRDGASKSYQIASREMWRPRDELIKEASKCDLLCANCHCEVHSTEGTMGPKKRLNASAETSSGGQSNENS